MNIQIIGGPGLESVGAATANNAYGGYRLTEEAVRDVLAQPWEYTEAIRRLVHDANNFGNRILWPWQLHDPSGFQSMNSVGQDD